MITLFCELPVGARFEFRGRRYEKLALSLACDEERCGNVFQDRTEVLAAPGVVRVEASTSPRPAGRPWTDHMARAPGQGLVNAPGVAVGRPKESA